MPLRLVIHPPRGPVRPIVLEPGLSRVLGRGPDCDIRLDDPRLSHRHVRLVGTADGCLLTDLGSKNGLMVDGRVVREAQLKPGAWASFGGLLARLETVSETQLAREAAAGRRRRESSRRLAAGLDSALGGGALLHRLLDSVLELTSLERGFILMGRDGTALQPVCARGLETAEPAAFAGSRGAIELALHSGETLVVSDTAQAAALAGRASIAAGGIRALACVPLTVDETLRGVVYADGSRPGILFTGLDVEILAGLGEQAALALKGTNLRRELDALRDALRHDVAGLGRLLPGLRATALGG